MTSAGPDPPDTPPAAPAAPVWRRRLRDLLTLYVVYSLVFGIGLTLRVCLPWRGAITTSPADLAPRAREVRFPSRDGLELVGYYAPPVGSRPMLIFLHGVGANRDDVLPWARVLADRGYGLLCFDWRGHGESAGRVITFAAREPHDLMGALAFLDTLPELSDRPLGILSQSMGAAVAAATAPELPPRVRCMVLDSPFGSLSRMVGTKMRYLGPLKLFPALVVDLTARLLIGRSPSSVQPERSLAAFAPRPVLVFHGTADIVIPCSEGRSLFEAYPGPKDLWITEGDGHVEARLTRTREWFERVATFLADSLPGAPSAQEVLSGGA